jgi:hypothetical protein
MDDPAKGDAAALLATASRTAGRIASDTTLTIYHEAAMTREVVGEADARIDDRELDRAW